MSTEEDPPALSLTEWAVLALIAEAPTHGFAAARSLAPDSDLGRILTVRRSLVYRAIDRLVDGQMIAADRTEAAPNGQERTIYKVSPTGRRCVDAWLRQPVGHLRDIRIELLLKLRLLERRGEPTADLAAAQQASLAPTIDALDATRPDVAADVVDAWRHHTAVAARAFLDALCPAPSPRSANH